MVDAEAGKPSDGVTAAQVIQTDNALALILRQHVICNQRTSPSTKILHSYKPALGFRIC